MGYNKKYYEEHKEQQLEHSKHWREQHPKQLAKIMRINHYRHKYSCTILDYVNQLNLQNGCCLICGRTDNYNRKHFDIDHDHITGKMRGLLCTACNMLVGRIENDYKAYTKVQFEQVQNYLAFFVDITDLEVYNTNNE